MSERTGRVLVVDDKQDILVAIRMLLQQHVEVVQLARDPAAIPSLMADEDYDLVLLDMNFRLDASSGREGFQWLRYIRDHYPSVVVILITAYGDIEKAVQGMKEGATDFLVKPWSNEKLLSTVTTAIRLRRSRCEADRLWQRQERLSEDLDQPFHEIVGHSPAIRRVFETVEKVAVTDANVLLLGESGTGKELIARAIHRQSKRAQEIFVNVDLGSLSESLFEGELFGHVKGAFTGASEGRPGRFEVASGGTLFLDEIGNIPLPLQAKLLTVLQRREVTRVGSTQPTPVDIRIISATNQTVHDLVRQGRFRQDLLYRINTVEIRLPALRERKEDIPLLAQHFLNIYSRKYQKPVERLSSQALNKLERYRWPGNVRELQHTLERAVILCENDLLQASDFSFSTLEESPAGEMTLDNLDLEKLEQVAVLQALSKHGGNISRAARELGISRKALYRRVEKYGL
jgi:two-component system, NtrC family, response regulator HydG